MWCVCVGKKTHTHTNLKSDVDQSSDHLLLSPVNVLPPPLTCQRSASLERGQQGLRAQEAGSELEKHDEAAQQQQRRELREGAPHCCKVLSAKAHTMGGWEGKLFTLLVCRALSTTVLPLRTGTFAGLLFLSARPIGLTKKNHRTGLRGNYNACSKAFLCRAP